MSLAAIKQITELEQELRQRWEDAQAAAKKTVAAAETAGQALLEQTRLQTGTAGAQALAEVERQAGEQAKVIMEQAQKRCAALQCQAKARMDTAVAMIIERVVGC